MENSILQNWPHHLDEIEADIDRQYEERREEIKEMDFSNEAIICNETEGIVAFVNAARKNLKAGYHYGKAENDQMRMWIDIVSGGIVKRSRYKALVSTLTTKWNKLISKLIISKD